MPNWNEILNEIEGQRQQGSKTAADDVRRRYLKALFDHTGRNVIAYYSGWLSKTNLPFGINDEDKNGFMTTIHQLDRQHGLDLILHTPGGNVAATESIVHYLHKMFANDIRVIVPQIAMSAGTMIACSAKEILMGTHSNLGPIDPQLRDIPANGVIREFRRAFREIDKNPTRLPIWQTIIGQYRPTFLSQCENAIQWAKTFVTEELESVMFEGDPEANTKARNIVKALTDYRRGKQSHERHLHYEDCEEIGLKVKPIEQGDDFQDLVLTIHHCFMHTLMNTSAYRIIENHNGVAFIKQQRQQVIQPIIAAVPPNAPSPPV